MWLTNLVRLQFIFSILCYHYYCCYYYLLHCFSVVGVYIVSLDFVRSCPGIPCRWLPAGHRRSRKTTAFRWHEDADCPPNIVHTAWNSLPSDLRKADLSVFRQTVRPRRIVNSINCGMYKYSYILTYSLTYLLNSLRWIKVFISFRVICIVLEQYAVQ